MAEEIDKPATPKRNRKYYLVCFTVENMDYGSMPDMLEFDSLTEMLKVWSDPGLTVVAAFHGVRLVSKIVPAFLEVCDVDGSVSKLSLDPNRDPTCYPSPQKDLRPT